MKKLLWSGAIIALLVGCGSGGGNPESTDAGVECQELNEKLVYSEKFAERFGLPVDEATVLESGLLAVRLYWTELMNPLFGESPRPVLHAQFYLEESVPLHLAGKEGTLSDYESRVRSGFRYFEHEPPRKGENIWERDHEEFRNRVIAVDEGIETISLDITRYKRELIPGIQAVEVSMLLPHPTHVFFYVGDEPPTLYTLGPTFHRVSRDVDDYDSGEFMRVELPDELREVFQNPYVQAPDKSDALE